jgi:hypothetical protein
LESGEIDSRVFPVPVLVARFVGSAFARALSSGVVFLVVPRANSPTPFELTGADGSKVSPADNLFELCFELLGVVLRS